MVVVYVGWKGFDINIIGSVVLYFGSDVKKFIVWVGFVISGFCYEVDV